ncbi:SLIT and NTRK-like protein 5 [Coccinella septempunctata]|uniref:SLIT and NTRK-like protein 5 n=1 Tax=Coccinella septempunctata TaxID=41139 RepID=UPI001D08CE49|nr:SLIT and NTRK-like protein 5 [Coccinella septempunctata]
MPDSKLMIFVIIFVTVFVQCHSRQSPQYTFQNVTVHLKVANQSQPWRKIFIARATSAISFLNKTGARVKVIQFKQQRIPVLFRNSLSEVTKVSKLKLNGCGVQEIHPDFLSNRAKIFEFDLSENEIRDIKYGVFTDINIKRLYLNNNKIHQITNEAFSNMKKLELIILSNNRLTAWDSSWFLGTPVRHVDFSSNLIEELPQGAFDYFQEFKKKTYGEFFYINFNNNLLTKLRKGTLPEVNSLWFLFLEKNFIEEIEYGFFSGIKKMEALKLGNNRLSIFDSHLLEDLNLRYLKIDTNYIQNIDVNITEILNISNNPLSQECRMQWNERLIRDRARFERFFYVS